MTDKTFKLADFLQGLWDLRYVVVRSGRDNVDVIWMPKASEIGQPDQLQRLANLLAGLDMARRDIPDFMIERIRDFAGRIIDADTGEVIDTETFDVLSLLADDDDGWFSDFLRLATRTPRQRAQRRVIPRLKALSVAVQIAYKSDSLGRYFRRPEEVRDQVRKLRELGPTGDAA